jgi:hypothetical protein
VATAAVITDGYAEIDQRIAGEHTFMIEVIGQAMGELREQIGTNVRREFEEQQRPLCVDLCDTRICCADLRIAHAELRERLTAGHVTDLANPLGSGGVN